jgi:gamma-tubulin complex component 2
VFRGGARLVRIATLARLQDQGGLPATVVRIAQAVKDTWLQGVVERAAESVRRHSTSERAVARRESTAPAIAPAEARPVVPGALRSGAAVMIRSLSGPCRHITCLAEADVAVDREQTLAEFLAPPMAYREKGAPVGTGTVDLSGPGVGHQGEEFILFSTGGAGGADTSIQAGQAITLKSTYTHTFLGVDPLSGNLRCRATAPGPEEMFQLCTPELLTNLKHPDPKRRDVAADAILSDIAASLAHSDAPPGSQLVFLNSPVLIRSLHTGQFVSAVDAHNPPRCADLARAAHFESGTMETSGLHPGSGSGVGAFGFTYDGDGSHLVQSEGSGASLPVPPSFRWSILPYGAPFIPPWSLSRPFLTGAHVVSGPALLQSSRAAAVKPLGSFPKTEQEILLAADVVDAMLGFTGRYVVAISKKELASGTKPDPSNPQAVLRKAAVAAISGDGLSDVEFVLSNCSGSDPSLLEIARRMLTLARGASRCRQFVERRSRPDSGLTAQSLAAAADALLHEFGLLLTQIEASQLAGQSTRDAAQFSMQQLWYMLQPSMNTLNSLVTVLEAAGEKQGGALLDTVATLGSSAGDESTRAVCRFLLQRVASPFLRQVEAWVFHGELSEDRGLFMIQPSSGLEDLMGSIFHKRSAPTTAKKGEDTGDAAAVVEEEGDDPAERFWTSCYSLVPEHCPMFLRKHAQAILDTGKHLAALRLCATDIDNPTDAAAAAAALSEVSEGFDEDDDDLSDPARALHLDSVVGTALRAAGTKPREARRALEFSTESRTYEAVFRRANSRAARALLRHVNDRCHLPSWLEGMRRYFLLAQGDFLAHFLDTANEELEKLADPLAGLGVSLAARGGARKIASLQKLRSLVELSVRMSSASFAEAAADPAREALSCHLEASRLVDRMEDVHLSASAAAHDPAHVQRRRKRREGSELRAHSAFCLDVDVPWPVCLVLRRSTVSKYQLLFRHLFTCKHVERRLAQAWSALQDCKELNLQRELAHSHALRGRMQHFMRNLVYYMTIEAIEPHWTEMQRRLSDCHSLDQVRNVHDDFLDRSLKDCLLTSFEALKPLDRLVTLCGLFADRLAKDIESHKPDEAEVARMAGIEPSPVRKAREVVPVTSAGGAMLLTGTSDDDKETQAALRRAREQHRRRSAKVNAQSESMGHTMRQAGWQGIILRSSDMFDRLLKQFLSKLLALSSDQYRSHLVHLFTRLDYNGYYSTTLGLERGAHSLAAMTE